MSFSLVKKKNKNTDMPKKRRKFLEKEMNLTEEVKPFLDMIAPSLVRFSSDKYILGTSHRCVWAIRA